MVRVNSRAPRIYCDAQDRLGGESAEGVVSCAGLKEPPGFKGLNTYSALVQTLRQDSEGRFVQCVALVCLS